MSLYNYTFMGEVEAFNLDEYTPVLAEIGASISDFTIYSLSGSEFLFLYNKKNGKLYQFYAIDDTKPASREEYEDVIKSYLLVDL